MANLITAQEVIELAFSENSNMREESIPKTTIGVAEIKYIRPAFGAMYALLADKYADFTNEYVKPALAYFVKCEMMSSIAIDMSNSGVAVSNPQYQNAASDKQRQRLYDSEMGKAKTLLDYALSYIAVHSEEFPDYSGPISKKSYRVGGILLGNERVATSIMGEAFKEEYERYLREMQEINEVVVDATEDVSKALIATNEAIANTEEAVAEANTATTNANTATEKAEEATQKANATISNAEKATNRANTAAENAEKVGEDIQRVEKKADDNAKEIQNINENAVQPDDYYPKMSVGFANNLVGRGEATAEEFTYRASAGMGRSITDDVARVKKIKGNSVVWNQGFNTSTLKSYDYLTVSKVDEITFELNGTTKDNLTWIASDVLHSFIASHKVYVYAEEIGGEASINYHLDNGWGVVFSPNTPQILDVKYTDSGLYIRGGGCTFNNLRIRLHTTDLTQMFGAGNEPTTIEEFYARIPSGIDIFAYNEGEIINLNIDAIKTVGLNQWDEQWKVGYYDINSGNWIYSNNVICSVNPIPVISGAEYYAHFGYANYAWGVFYDKNAQVIGVKTIANKIFTVPTGAMYMHFYTNQSKGDDLNTVYHHDICINLSHTGTENGKYKPYTPFTRELPIIQKYFPNGMRSAGIAFDSIEWDSSKQKWVAVQRIGEVDLGSLSWQLDHISFISGSLPVLGAEPIKWTTPTNSLCSKYQIASQSQLFDDLMDKTIASWGSIIRLLDTSYTNVSELKSALQGVMFYYELAEPIVTEIEEEFVNFDYYVEDFGTEEALSDVPSAPFRADVVYTFNAVDTIRNNYLAIEEMKKQMAQMQNAISAMQTAQVKEQE